MATFPTPVTGQGWQARATEGAPAADRDELIHLVLLNRLGLVSE